MTEEINDKVAVLKKETAALRKEFKEKTLGYIMGALGLVAGLAWNEAIKGTIEYFFPAGGSGILLKFVYATLITIILVVISLILAKFFIKKEEK